MMTIRSRRHGPRSSRRRWLGGLLGAGFAPLLTRLCAPRLAHAAPAEASARARRFVGIYAPHGVARELWVPGPGFNLRYTDCSLSPFDDAAAYGKSFREHVTITRASISARASRRAPSATRGLGCC